MVKHIKGEDFEKEVIENEQIVLVDFFATWCGPCQMLSPVLEKLSQEKPELKIVKIDIDENTQLAINDEVQVVPTVIIYKNGKKVGRFEGFRDEEEIIDIIENVK